jgi:hypothetical protein
MPEFRSLKTQSADLFVAFVANHDTGAVGLGDPPSRLGGCGEVPYP